jgi:hypothetical protein
MTARVLNPDLDWKEFRATNPRVRLMLDVFPQMVWFWSCWGSTNFLHLAQTFISTQLSTELVKKMWNQTQKKRFTKSISSHRLVVFSAALEIIRSKAFRSVLSWKSETIKWFKSLFGSRVVSGWWPRHTAHWRFSRTCVSRPIMTSVGFEIWHLSVCVGDRYDRLLVFSVARERTN